MAFQPPWSVSWSYTDDYSSFEGELQQVDVSVASQSGPLTVTITPASAHAPPSF